MAYSPHALDLPLVFDNVNIARALLGPGEEPQALAAAMADTWIAFARSGDPNNNAIPTWPAYDPRRRATMIFDATLRLENDPVRGIRQVLPQA